MRTSEPYERTFDEEPQRDDQPGCPDCGGRVTTTGHETVCDDCGLVLDASPIDHGPEWRTFEDEPATNSRTGGPVTHARHDRGLSTEIGSGQDANGNTLSGRKQRQMSRLRTRHSRARYQSKRERNLAIGCVEIARLVSALDLSRALRERASSLFRKAQSEHLLKGRSIEALAAGSVYGACRTDGVLRTIEEVADVARCDREKVLLGYRVLNTELGIASRPISPGDILPRLFTALEVPPSIRSRAADLAQRAREEGLVSGRSPSGVAAGCLYLASEEHGGGLRQEAIAEVADVTPVTLRARYQELQERSESPSPL
ncbi:transcription initiation factor IIB [Haloparvum sedimenti]|uniref:transcription initiation factor IIB n=1 Tax=Haloparvum sedimenti TaxID=1678448 RepID=UPI00071E785C|nr:transcription initiation factor IIB family protein [Haloparvum sedimenti]